MTAASTMTTRRNVATTVDPLRHLLSIDDLGADGIEEVLRLTDTFAEVSRRTIPRVPALRGKTVVSLFYEDSTRTRLSFEQAAKRLSADTMNFSVSTSSVKKGESLRDTVLTIEAMGVDALVVRHASAGVPWQIASWVGRRHRWSTPATAGTSTRPRPCSTATRSAQHHGGLGGRRIAIVGDIKHSRVARSDVLAFTALGAEVTLVAPADPAAAQPRWLARRGQPRPRRGAARDRRRLPAAHAAGADDRGAAAVASRVHGPMGLDRPPGRPAPEHALVMHPGPMNRGVEIAAEVADLPRSVIIDQVRNGVAVRMAVLYVLLGANLDLAEAEPKPMAEAEK